MHWDEILVSLSAMDKAQVMVACRQATNPNLNRFSLAHWRIIVSSEDNEEVYANTNSYIFYLAALLLVSFGTYGKICGIWHVQKGQEPIRKIVCYGYSGPNLIGLLQCHASESCSLSQNWEE